MRITTPWLAKKRYLTNIFILKTKIPIYVGSDKSLLDIDRPHDDNPYHGRDGLGDTPDPEPVDESLIKAETASNAIVRLCREHKGFLRTF